MHKLKDETIELIKEKLILQLIDLEELIEIEKNKGTKKYLKTQYTKISNKLKKIEKEIIKLC